MNRSRSNSGLVYTTDAGRMCPLCRKPLAACACRSKPAPVGDGNVRVAREVHKRGGKVVTVIRGLPLAGAELDALARQVKVACGCGGSVKDGVVEIQGEHRDRIVDWLQRAGYAARRAGG